MVSQLVGEAAAITTSVMWTICSILFAYAGRRIGALSVNSTRLLMAICLLAITHLLLLGTIIPMANYEQWFYMGLSGVIGLGIGDFGYFGALVILGPRRGTLMMSLSAMFAIIAGYPILNESLNYWQLLGIIITLSGVTWVILEREGLTNEIPLTMNKKILGVLFGICGAAGQGVGLVISKYGIVIAAENSNAPLHPISAALIRMIAAAIFIWIALIIVGKFKIVKDSLKDRKAITATFGGAFFGPFLGVSLSMVAVTYAIAGVAQTLMSLMPVMIIPVIWILYRQKTTWRGFLGAVCAIIGVAILLLI